MAPHIFFVFEMIFARRQYRWGLCTIVFCSVVSWPPHLPVLRPTNITILNSGFQQNVVCPHLLQYDNGCKNYRQSARISWLTVTRHIRLEAKTNLRTPVPGIFYIIEVVSMIFLLKAYLVDTNAQPRFANATYDFLRINLNIYRCFTNFHTGRGAGNDGRPWK